MAKGGGGGGRSSSRTPIRGRKGGMASGGKNETVADAERELRYANAAYDDVVARRKSGTATVQEREAAERRRDAARRNLSAARERETLRTANRNEVGRWNPHADGTSSYLFSQSEPFVVGSSTTAGSVHVSGPFGSRTVPAGTPLRTYGDFLRVFGK